ncbi:MAG: hypothetical protein JXM69_11050 [Anaerolineae bacterium]|nr:hypothetical protein [Anaerolineae bacterium]
MATLEQLGQNAEAMQSINGTLKVVLWSLLEAYGVEVEDLEVSLMDIKLTQPPPPGAGVDAEPPETCWRIGADGQLEPIPCS